MMCTSIGADCVVFQGQAPLNLFTLTMQNADIVDTIEESSGSTESYNDLTNKPQINSVTLTGNKSLSDLGIAAASSFAVGSSDNGKVLTAIYEEGQGSYAWVTPSGGGGTTDYTLLENKPQINSVTLTGNKSLSDLGIAAASDIPTVPITEIQKNSTTISPVSGVVNITVPTSAADVSAIPTTEKGANSGVATLDSSGKLTAAQLPLGTTSTTAYRGDRGNTAYTHATDSSRLTTATASGLYKVASTNQGHIASLTAVEKSDITALGIPAQDTTYNNATTSTAGLMSAADKTKLDNLTTEYKEISLNSQTWNSSSEGQGIYYSDKISLSTLSTIYGWVWAGFNTIYPNYGLTICQVPTEPGYIRVYAATNTFQSTSQMKVTLFGSKS